MKMKHFKRILHQNQNSVRHSKTEINGQKNKFKSITKYSYFIENTSRRDKSVCFYFSHVCLVFFLRIFGFYYFYFFFILDYLLLI